MATLSPAVDGCTPTPPYTDLVPSNIRLITLNHNEESSELSITLSQVPLTEDLEFYALSYVWDDGLAKRTLQMNGHAFEVSQHLYNFLETIRQYGPVMFPSELSQRANFDVNEKSSAAQSGTRWWIDAICIDQSNLEERNEIVPRMSEIYAGAGRVWVWFGLPEEVFPPPTNTNIWFQVFRLIDDDNKRIKSERESFLAQIARLELFQEQSDVCHETSALADGEVPESSESLLPELAGNGNSSVHAIPSRKFLLDLFTKLSALALHKYFTRIWIIQEYVLAKRTPMFIIGPYVFLLDHLIEATHRLFDQRILLDEDLGSRASDLFFASTRAVRLVLTGLGPMLMNRTTSNMDVHPSVFFIYMWRVSYESKATIAHDLFYGMLGLWNEEELPSVLKPDYRQNFEQVSLNYAKYLIENSRDLRILETYWNDLDGCPSWVPDIRYRMQPIDYLSFTPPATGSVSISPDGGKLSVEGSLIGTILHCTCCDQDRVNNEDNLDFLRDVIFPDAARITNRSVNSVFGDWLCTYLQHLGSGGDAFRTTCASLDEFRTKLAQLQAYPDDGETCPEPALCSAMGALAKRTFLLVSSGDIISGRKRGTQTHHADTSVWVLKGSVHPTLLTPEGDNWIFRGNAILMGPRRLDWCCGRNDISLEMVMLGEEYFAKRKVEQITIV